MTAADEFGHWRAISRDFLSLLDRLADDQLDFVPREGLWSLGTVVRHVAEAEDGWFRHVVLHELPHWPEYAAGDHATVASLKALLTDVHARTERYLASLDAADLDRRIVAPWGEEMTLRWIVWHVLEHEVHHRAEISLMFGLMGMEGLEV
jgi:uncharacterized damage-inducible protein DinB